MTTQVFLSEGTGNLFNLDVSRGFIAGHTPVYKFGHNPDVNGAEETVWEQGGIYSYPATAAALYVSSSSATDSNGGTGANSVYLQGLDANYNEVTETVNLNGQTQVQTANSYIRIYRAFVVLAGSDGIAAGTIYVGTSGATGGVPNGAIYASIAPAHGQTEMAIYTVPAGHTLYLDDINFTSAVSLANSYIRARFMTRLFGSNVFREQTRIVLQSNTYIFKFEYPLAFPEKTDLEVRAQAVGSNNNEISATWQGVLIKNDIQI